MSLRVTTWSRLVFSFGIVTGYIHNQKQRHAEGKLWESLEETYEEYDDEETDSPE